MFNVDYNVDLTMFNVDYNVDLTMFNVNYNVDSPRKSTVSQRFKKKKIHLSKVNTNYTSALFATNSWKDTKVDEYH